MSPEQFNEAKRLIAGGMKIRPAAKQVGISESTLRVALKRDTQPAPPAEPVSEPEPLSESQLLPPGIADAIGSASDRAKREAEEARQREHFEFLSDLRKRRAQ